MSEQVKLSVAPSHWSKDFVEHLRTVHFALVIAATVLTVTGLYDESSRLNTALIQIEQIASLQGQWSGIKSVVKNRALRDANVEEGDWTIPLALIGPDLKRTPVWIQVHTRDRDDRVEIDDQWDSFRRWSTLGEFKNIWNQLHRGSARVTVYYPPAEDSPCELHYAEHAKSCAVRGAADLTHSFGEQAPPGSFSVDANTSDNILVFVGDFLKFTRYSKQGVAAMKGTKRFDNKTYQPFKLDLSIDLKSTTKRLDEKLLKETYFHDWKEGTFKDAFPQLNAVSSDLDLIPIAEAVQRIASRQATSEKNVSLVGFNVPISQLSQWGILILLCIQLYFWLHLHELTSRIEPGAEGWDVAWIGVYRTRMAMLVSVLSCSLLPSAASLLLARRLNAADLYYPRTIFGLSYGAVIVSVTLSMLTIKRLLDLRLNLSAEGKIKTGPFKASWFMRVIRRANSRKMAAKGP